MSEQRIAQEMEPPGHQRWLVLAGGIAVVMILGTVYGFSALVEPLKHAFPDWTTRDIQLGNTLALLFFAIAMVPAGWLQDRYGPRLTPMLAAGFFLTGFFLTSLVHEPSQKWLFWLGYGVFSGSAVGLATVSPLAALVKWFPSRKGLISGIAVSGFGIGAAIFIPTAGAYLAPQGEHAVQSFFRLHALVTGIVVFVGGWVLRNPSIAQGVQGRTVAPVVADVAWQSMVRTGRFWTLWSLMALSCTAGLMTIAVVKVAVKEAPGITLAQAALAGSLLSIFNALGRPCWGVLSDRIGRDRTFAVMLSLQAAAMFALAPGLAHGAVPVFVLVAVIGACFGGNFALFAPATADAFGIKNLGVNYGLVFTGYGVAGVIGPQVAAYYKDALGAYAPAFMVAGVLVALGAVLAVITAVKSSRPALALVEPLQARPLPGGEDDDAEWMRRAAD